jgi:hypothetical protein
MRTPRRATRPNGEWRYSTLCRMMGRECPEAVLPDMALYFPTFSDLLIVNKLLSLSPLSPLSLSLSHDGSRILWCLSPTILRPSVFSGPSRTQRRRLISRQEIHLRQRAADSASTHPAASSSAAHLTLKAAAAVAAAEAAASCCCVCV